MTVGDLIARTGPPAPWGGADKIPWHERSFSRRLLDEHLDQSHDAASRGFEMIDRQVAWIHEQVLVGKPARVLDLCCGPGFYAARLASLGHCCTGVDFSPSAVSYARAEAADRGLDCRYVEGDIRTTAFGESHDLAMMLFGEFNAFAGDEMQAILRRLHAALSPGGCLLLEPQRFDSVRELGEAPPYWQRESGGLFADRPHLYLEEHFWDEERHIATDRYYVLDAATAEVAEYGNTRQAYTHAEITALLGTAGFENIAFHPSLTGSESDADEDCFAVTAVRM